MNDMVLPIDDINNSTNNFDKQTFRLFFDNYSRIEQKLSIIIGFLQKDAINYNRFSM